MNKEHKLQKPKLMIVIEKYASNFACVFQMYFQMYVKNGKLDDYFIADKSQLSFPN